MSTKIYYIYHSYSRFNATVETQSQCGFWQSRQTKCKSYVLVDFVMGICKQKGFPAATNFLVH